MAANAGYRTRCGNCGRGFYTWSSGRKHLEYRCAGAGLHQWTDWSAEPAPEGDPLTALGFPDAAERRTPVDPFIRLQQPQRRKCQGLVWTGRDCAAPAVRRGDYCTNHFPAGVPAPAGYAKCPNCLRVVKSESVNRATGLCVKGCLARGAELRGL